MKTEEFAFFNEQLANMVRDGIPLEGALRRLCGSMRRGRLRGQLHSVEAALAGGTPIDEALSRSGLPPLYVQMVLVGAKANNLPAVLTLMADHYRRVSAIGARLAGLLFYPALILGITLGLSLYFALVLHPRMAATLGDLSSFGLDTGTALGTVQVQVLVPPLVLAVLAAGFVAVLTVPALRRGLRWRLPPFREASLSQLASALAVLLRGGSDLAGAVGLLQRLEGHSRAGAELARWEARMAEGHSRFADIAGGGSLCPPLFLWLVDSAGEDLAAGLERAAELYQGRATHRVEMLLYGALPISIVLLASMLFTQVTSLLRVLVQVMNLIGGMS